MEGCQVNVRQDIAWYYHSMRRRQRLLSKCPSKKAKKASLRRARYAAAKHTKNKRSARPVPCARKTKLPRDPVDPYTPLVDPETLVGPLGVGSVVSTAAAVDR